MSYLGILAKCLCLFAAYVTFKAADLDGPWRQVQIPNPFINSRELNDPTLWKGFQQKNYSLVAHSHNDPGWILTMKEYEERVVDDIIGGSVEYLDKEQLLSKFTYSDISFLQSWLKRYPGHRDLLMKQVKSGRLEIINGGISMHDQACTHFDDIINNYEYGREYTKDNFGYLPEVAWSIDPFGSTRGSARLFQEIGYTSLTINRVPYKLKDKMRFDRDLIFKWKSSNNSDETLLTYTTAGHYATPEPIRFYSLYPFDRSPKQPEDCVLAAKFNLGHLAYQAFEIVDTLARNYRDKNILLLLGDDFTFKDFQAESQTLEKILVVWNSNSKTGRLRGNHFKFSHIGEFFDKLKNEANEYITTDFREAMPLIDRDVDEGEFSWTGYFTTRPYLKRRMKLAGQLYRSVSHLLAAHALSKGYPSEHYDRTYYQLEDTRFALGILMHHDAISGTCYRHVAEDYIRMIDEIESNINQILKFHLADIVSGVNLQVMVNQSYFYEPDIETSKTFVLMNTQNTGIDSRISIRYRNYHKGRVHPSMSHIHSKDMRYHESCVDGDMCDMIVYAKLSAFVPVAVYVDLRAAEVKMNKSTACQGIGPSNDGWIRIGGVDLAIHRHDGYFYDKVKRKSGAYVFTTKFEEPQMIILKNITYEGNGEVCLIGAVLDYQTGIRISIEVNPKEFESGLAPIRATYSIDPLWASQEADFVIRYRASSISSKGAFFVDSNGLESFEHTYDTSRPACFSYLPATNFAQIQDQSSKLTILTDRTAGVTSPHPGMLEVGLTRINYGRDNLGVQQLVQEDESVDITHTVLLTQADSMIHRRYQMLADSGVVYGVCDGLCHGNVVESEISGMIWVYIGRNAWLRVTADVRPSFIAVRMINMHEMDNIDIEDVVDLVKKQYNIKSSFSLQRTTLDANGKAEPALTQPAQLTLKPLAIATFKLKLTK